MRRIAAHRSWVVVRLVLGCSLVLGLMGYPSAFAAARATIVSAQQRSTVATANKTPIAPPAQPSTNDALPSAAPEPNANLISPTVKAVGPDVIMPMPEGAADGNGNQLEQGVPPPDPLDDTPTNTNLGCV